MSQNIEIEVNTLYQTTGTAKLADIDDYVVRACEIAGNGNNVRITGQGPIWLYLKIAHALHGKVRKLTYNSPVTGDVIIYDHNPF